MRKFVTAAREQGDYVTTIESRITASEISYKQLELLPVPPSRPLTETLAYWAASRLSSQSVWLSASGRQA